MVFTLNTKKLVTTHIHCGAHWLSFTCKRYDSICRKINIQVRLQMDNSMAIACVWEKKVEFGYSRLIPLLRIFGNLPGQEIYEVFLSHIPGIDNG